MDRYARQAILSEGARFFGGAASGTESSADETDRWYSDSESAQAATRQTSLRDRDRKRTLRRPSEHAATVKFRRRPLRQLDSFEKSTC